MKPIKTLTVGGETYQITDPSATRLADDAVDTQTAWSSKNIVDKLCPGFTETGAVVTCQPVEGYPLEVKGDGTIYHFGKNLIGHHDYSGITSTNRTMSCTDGVHKSVFAGAVSTTYIITGDVHPYMKNRLLVPGTYVFSVSQESTGRAYTGCYATVTLEDGTTVDLPDGEAVTLSQSGTVTHFRCSGSQPFTAGTEINFTLQIEAGKTATDYEPHRGEEFADGGAFTVTAYPGINTVYSDGRDVTVAGRADPTAIIEKLQSAIFALGGNI